MYGTTSVFSNSLGGGGGSIGRTWDAGQGTSLYGSNASYGANASHGKTRGPSRGASRGKPLTAWQTTGGRPGAGLGSGNSGADLKCELVDSLRNMQMHTAMVSARYDISHC